MTTAIKTCIKCSDPKPAEEYYKHSMMVDGRLGKCKECCRLGARKNRADNIERYRAHDKKRNATSERRAKRVEFNNRPEQQPKRQARMGVMNALRRGDLIRPDECSRCGIECKPHGHHADYSKQLNVVWLCQVCHQAEH